MQAAKYHVLLTTFSYGGNGGLRSEHPHVGRWITKTTLAARDNPLVGRFDHFEMADTPITMARNNAVLKAREIGADVLVMVDSDMSPDYLLGRDPSATPFFDSSLAFLDARRQRGLETVVFSPYCGPSPHQNPYCFLWRNQASNRPANHPDLKLEAYSREEAAAMTGIQEAAAGPTGLIMFSLPVLELTEPKTDTDDHETLALFKAGELGEIETLRRLKQRSWFYYEMDRYESKKHSTEDVTATRDLSILGIAKLGYNPLFCNWDAWGGHWKPELVGKPQVLTCEAVGQKYIDAIRGIPGGEKLAEVDYTSSGQEPGVRYQGIGMFNGHRKPHPLQT